MSNLRKRIVLTGGGTAGHVMLHLALQPYMEKEGWELFYVGSKGIEKQLVSKAGIPFFEISCGKLRRYFSFENLADVFRIMKGVFQSILHLYSLKPDLVFSKGGFVSVPVALAAWILRIPVVTHESDLTPGLATKIISSVARYVLCSFPETKKFLPPNKAVFTGAAIRDELLAGDRTTGFQFCGFDSTDPKPVILVMGGSLGAERLNDLVARSLPLLLPRFRIVHLTGRGKTSAPQSSGYKVFEYVGEELKHIFAITDFVMSRAGANAIFEFLALKKPMILIPLQQGSRGDQVYNAESFVKNGFATMLLEAQVTPEILYQKVCDLVQRREEFKEPFSKAPTPHGGLIMEVLRGCLHY